MKQYIYGFVNILIEIKENSNEIVTDWVPGFPISNYIASATVQAEKLPNEEKKFFSKESERD
ncbi:MAG TPA: hypothetical protein G4N92_07450 [Anaerolineae bacterium]|nr:hypothetical protein [Anaerolineae bacterium]